MTKHTLLLIIFIMVFSSLLVASNEIADDLEEQQAYSWEIKDRLEQLGITNEEFSPSIFLAPVGSLFLEKKNIVR